MDNKTEIEQFFGVYLLCSQSSIPKYRNKVYIGFTVNPNRRIKQHNLGKEKGGAKKTNQRGPWTMVMIVYGFPNNISALRFEWAWQKPKESRRIKNIPGINKKPNEGHFDYNFRILSEMLRIGPWNRLPLTLRWLASDFVRDFPVGKTPPAHMLISHGQVKIKKSLKSTQECDANANECNFDLCTICLSEIDLNSNVKCLNPKCNEPFHIICLASKFKSPGQYIPVEGDCPKCQKHMLWGDIIRKLNGCNDLEEMNSSDSENDIFSLSDSDSN